MKYKLEVVVVPVSDVDRAKAFYAEQMGFVVDHDTQITDERRVVQLPPPGSACSIMIGTGLAEMAPGFLQGLQLVVTDLDAARAELVGRGSTSVRFRSSDVPEDPGSASCSSTTPTGTAGPCRRSGRLARRVWRHTGCAERHSAEPS